MGVVWLYVALLSVYTATSVAVDPCEIYKTCSECIRDPSVCAWCAADNLNGTRCKSANTATKEWCPRSLQNPQNNITESDSLEFNSELGKVIQIKPQRYKVRLRPGVPTDFEFSFKGASDYPVDLYFLLDASRTMATVKNSIEHQSKNIYTIMKTLTNNIHLGMGTFIDKNTFPYTDILNSTMTYSFKNRLQLTSNVQEFRESVKDLSFGYNLDEPEGGLDALAQVIRCKNHIGWRDESRKMILFLTNAEYHSAGDGFTAGIFQPYDGKCHVDDAGAYTKELEMDYPSVSIINKMAADEQVIVIFMVNPGMMNIYSYLSEAIGGSLAVPYTGDKIATLLSDIYEKITTTIKLNVNFKSGQRHNFHITVDPNCGNITQLAACGVKKNEEKHFKGTIKLLKYFDVDSTTIDIMIEGIKEKITIDVEIIKDCECQQESVKKAPDCNNAGTLQCGICECDPKRYGDRCACEANSHTGVARVDNSTCIAPGDSELCTGHGYCFCGNCICSKDSPYEGKFCQFNKDNCPRHNELVCNGYGRCEGEKCICTDDAWSGDACHCPRSLKSCIGKNGKVCGNNGECKCGNCECRPRSYWDAREDRDRYCNITYCPDCHRPQCNILENCALCLHASNKECPPCTLFKASVTQYSVSTSNSSWNLCQDIRVEVGCYTHYMYRYDDDNNVIEMMVQAKTNCQESYYMFGGIFLASLILIGVATLVVWKWGTDARDRREYERFMKENMDDYSAPCTNPTYRPASTTINNPAFRKRSVDHR